ncbi:NUDIX hydrolase [bacterium]|nr:NUDIX hydrolase [bacterium]
MHRYRILWQGLLSPEQVELDYDPLRRFQAPAEWSSAAQQACRLAVSQGRQVKNLPLYHLLGWQQLSGRLRFQLGLTCYEDYLGLSLVAKDSSPTVLAVAAATEIEGRIVLERRSQAVAQGMGLMHVKPSGHVHPPHSPWQALLAEAWEELALKPEEVVDGQCLGLVQSLTANCYCLIYKLRTRLQWDEWRQRQPEDAWEADELFGLSQERASLDEWLARPAELSTGPGLAAVRLYRESLYGAL